MASRLSDLTNRLALGPAEVAVAIGVSETTVRRWMVEEGLPYSRVGGRILVRVDRLLGWLDSHQDSSCDVEDIVSLVEQARGTVEPA